jgi:hypothetical protein
MPELSYENPGFIRVKGTCPVFSKLLLPRYYNKASLLNTSPLYRYLASIPPKCAYSL